MGENVGGDFDQPLQVASSKLIAGAVDDVARLHAPPHQSGDGALELDALADPPRAAQHVEPVGNDIAQGFWPILESGCGRRPEVAVVPLPLAVSPPRVPRRKHPRELALVHRRSAARRGFSIVFEHFDAEKA